MKLIKIKLINFKTMKDFEYDFSDINLIYGDNGSGKTSILQAIQLLLTDKLPERLEEYIKWGEKSFSIELIFEIDLKIYTYIYTYTKQSNKILKCESKQWKGQGAAKKISELINSDLLLYSNIVIQGESYSIIKESSTKRLEKFKEILGLNRLINIIDAIKKQISNYKIDVGKLEKEINQLKQLKFEKMDEFELDPIDEIERELILLEKEKKQYDLNIELTREYNSNKKIYEYNLNKYNDLCSEIKDLESKTFDDIKFDKDAYEFLLEQKRNQGVLEKEHALKVKEFKTYESKKSSLDSKIKSLEDSKSKIVLLRISPLDFTQKDIDIEESSLSEYMLKLKELTNHLGLAKEGKCNTCGQDFNHDVSKIETSIEDLNKLILKLKLSIEDKKIKIKNTQDNEKTNLNSKEKLNDIQLKINELSEELSNLEIISDPGELELSVEDINKLILPFDILKKQIDIQEKEKEKISIKIKVLNESIKNLNLVEPTIPKFENCDFDLDLYNSLKNKKLLYDSKLEELNRILKFNKKIEENEKNNKKMIANLEKQYYILLGELKSHEEAKDILDKKFSTWVIHRGTDYVEKSMNSFFQKVYSKYSILFKPTENGKSLDFYYTDNEMGTIASASVASGFERQLIAMSFRLALATLTNIGFLILDEVDSDASDKNSSGLYSILIECGVFSQIIAITQKPETVLKLETDFMAKVLTL